MVYPHFDKTIHEQTKLKILTYLSSIAQSSFVEIKKDLKLTSGNLSIQLKTLEEKGLINQKRTIDNRKTITEVKITDEGKSALMEYLEEMENLLSHIKKGM
jgi:DNA-binding MarR family transcriptional regulator